MRTLLMSDVANFARLQGQQDLGTELAALPQAA